MPNLPPIELLPALVALLETASVTQAAARMHVGQPAMSRTLEKLRGALQDELLIRQGRGLVRTQRGEDLLPKAQAVLASAQGLLVPTGPFDPQSASGVVTLAMGDDMQALLAGPLLARLRQDAPGLDVRVQAIGWEVADALQRGSLDLLVLPDIRAESAFPGSSDLVWVPQYMRRFVTVTRRKRRLSLDAFVAAEHVLVSPQGQPGSYVDKLLAERGLERRVALTVASFQAALAVVARTDLVATFPEDVAVGLAPELPRQRCPVPTPSLPMCTVFSARLTQDKRHRWLRAITVEALQACDPQVKKSG